jgi:hypothetical protein
MLYFSAAHPFANTVSCLSHCTFPQAVSLSVVPPSRVQLVGGWADGTAAGLPGGCMDVAVQMPSSCMHHKDHLNYR